MATQVLYGREAELDALHGLIETVADGGSAVVLEGEPGIGKSTLLAAAKNEAGVAGLQVLSAAGVQSEAHLPFSGLHQLLQPLLADVNELPAPQRAALEVAFGITEGAAPDLFLIALATLELLGEAAARTPLLLLVEDAHLLDRSTADVLAFVGRRIELEPIVLLIAVRDGMEDPFAGSGLNELRLGALDDASARELLDAHAPELTPRVRERVLEEAAGNPLGLVELPNAIGSALEGTSLLPDHLPLSERLERAFADRLHDLPEMTQTLLLLAACDGACLRSELESAAEILRGSAPEPDALAPAIAAHLVHVGETEVRFRHPLVGSAVYQAASAPERLAAHAALAQLLAGRPDRSVWHRAASTVGSDELVAAELEATAARAQRRAAVAVALTALERAAALSEDPALRAGRLLRAGELAFELAGPELGLRFLREAEALELSASEGARLALLRELVEDEELWAGARVTSFVEIVDELRVAGDAELALSFLLAVAQRCWWIDLEQETRDLLVAAAERIRSSVDDPILTSIIAFADPLERGGVVIDRISRFEPGADLDSGAIRLLGAAATAVGAFDRSPELLAASVDGLRAEGRLGLLAQALVSQAWAAVFLGNWSLAAPAAAEAGRLARETAQPRWAAAGDLAQATLAALCGDYDAADSLTVEAERLLLPMVAHPTLAFVQLARGVTALGRGEHAEAYDQLHRIFDPGDVAYHPVVRCWVIGELAEAAAQSGHTDEARALMESLEIVARTSRSPLLLIGLGYARPVLADEADAGPLYEAALGPELNRWPFQRARLLLAYGAWLRRARRVAESRTPLRSARDAFDALGARPWGEHARQELRASGETSRGHEPAARNQLTPQELQIAQLAAAGNTNREIGQQLYLSHRTVGSHLYRIFPKLGITSRAQLGAALDMTSPV